MEIFEKNNIYGDYEVSQTGKVRNIKTNRLLKISKNRYGYYKVNLRKDKKQYNVTIHRLVATTFIPNPYNLPNVDHINRNKLDNSVSNLRWVSQKENMENTTLGRNCIYHCKLTNKFIVQDVEKKERFIFDKLEESFDKFKTLL